MTFRDKILNSVIDQFRYLSVGIVPAAIEKEFCNCCTAIQCWSFEDQHMEYLYIFSEIELAVRARCREALYDIKR